MHCQLRWQTVVNGYTRLLGISTLSVDHDHCLLLRGFCWTPPGAVLLIYQGDCGGYAGRHIRTIRFGKLLELVPSILLKRHKSKWGHRRRRAFPHVRDTPKPVA